MRSEPDALLFGRSVSANRRTPRRKVLEQTHRLKEFEPVRLAFQKVSDEWRS
jgi:hypothetical protein